MDQNCHNCFNSSTSGCIYTSKFPFGFLGPGTSKERNMNGFFMHMDGGKLYGVRMTGQHEYCPPNLPYGENPSVHSPSLTFLDSDEKSGKVLSKCFQASLSLWCAKVPTTRGFLACHLISFETFLVANSLCNLGVIGKYIRTFAGKACPWKSSCTDQFRIHYTYLREHRPSKTTYNL